MKAITVQYLGYHFTEIEALLERGRIIPIRDRKGIIAHLLPARPQSEVSCVSKPPARKSTAKK